MVKRVPYIALFLLLVSAPLHVALAGVTASFRYPLSNFSGPVPAQWAKLAVDPERNEVYALRQRKNDIRIFDEHGMEIFVFGDGFASAADISIGDDGDIFILSTGYKSATVHRLNYRGEHVSEIPLQDVPEAFSEFAADRLVYNQGSLYLVDSDALTVIVVDEAGRFERAHDLEKLLRPFVPRLDRESKGIANFDWKKRKLENIDLNGFTVDKEGNIFFTVPVLFSAYKLTVGGEFTPFGRSGSGRGKFGVAAGIATDERGYVYVADRLRCVVLVFDEDLNFQLEFGYRGDQPSNLIVPDDLAIDSSGNVYVGQAANRGVSVFKVVHQITSESQGSEKRSRRRRVLRSPARTSKKLRPIASSSS
jgi:DNA-binding beta-propeller fold protein YncE